MELVLLALAAVGVGSFVGFGGGGDDDPAPSAPGTPGSAEDDVLTADLLGEVYECDVRVMAHPDDGHPLVFL